MPFPNYIHALSGLYQEYEDEAEALILNPGASHDDIALLEQALDASLEVSLKDAWLCADGCDNTLFARAGYLTGYTFLSVQEALAQREGMRQREKQYAEYAEPKPRDERIKDGWFQSGWLPFASFGGATLLLMADYSPASGQPGQIIAFSHDPDQIEYVSDGFERFLESSWQQISEDPEEFLCY
jgi:cell wall assembly regulator SMI1